MLFLRRGPLIIALSLFVLLLLACGGTAFGKVYIDIDSPTFRQFPIAIADFERTEGSGGEPQDDLSAWFSDTLADSLRLTGFFNPLNKKAFLEDTISSGKVPGSITFGDWMAIGAEYLVKGNFSPRSGVITVTFRLFDAVRGELLTEKTYAGRSEDRLSMVRGFAGEVLLALTGERGVFNTKIAFVRKEGKTSDIHTINFDGTGLTRITHYRTIAMAPRWSPDGMRLSFTSYRDGNPDLYVTELVGGQTRKIAGYEGINLSGSWSPDGRKMLFTLSKDGNPEIYLLDMDSNLLKRLTQQFSIDVSPAWSPDGSKIVFVSDRSGSPQIYIMDADGANVKRLTYEGNYNTSPSWSPKGNRIAYEGLTSGNYQIFSIGADGNDIQQLTFDAGAHESPSWSPDGRYIAFCWIKGGRGEVSVMNANGTNRRLLFGNGDGVTGAAWSSRLESGSERNTRSLLQGK